MSNIDNADNYKFVHGQTKTNRTTTLFTNSPPRSIEKTVKYPFENGVFYLETKLQHKVLFTSGCLFFVYGAL
jgi:hypothetical protein